GETVARTGTDRAVLRRRVADAAIAVVADAAAGAGGADGDDAQRVAIRIAVVGQHRNADDLAGVLADRVIHRHRRAVEVLALGVVRLLFLGLETVHVDRALVPGRIAQCALDPRRRCRHRLLDPFGDGPGGHRRRFAALLDGEELDIDATVPAAVVLAVIRVFRRQLAAAADVDFVDRHALGDQVVANRAGTTLGQALVVGLRADVAGVTDQLHAADPLAAGDCRQHGVELALRLALHRRAVKSEIGVVAE